MVQRRDRGITTWSMLCMAGAGQIAAVVAPELTVALAAVLASPLSRHLGLVSWLPTSHAAEERRLSNVTVNQW